VFFSVRGVIIMSQVRRNWVMGRSFKPRNVSKPTAVCMMINTTKVWHCCFHLAQNARKYADFNVKCRKLSGYNPTRRHCEYSKASICIAPLRALL